MKSSRKTKRKWIWCIKSPIDIPSLGLKTNKNEVKWPKHFRCPKCNRRLRVKTVDCHEGYWEACLHPKIPAHKTYTKGK